MRAIVLALVASCVLLNVSVVFATYGLDLSAPVSESTAQCLKKNSFDFAVVRVRRSIHIFVSDRRIGLHGDGRR